MPPWLAVSAVLVLASAIAAWPGYTHEVTLADGRKANYKGLTVDGRSCCGDIDCRPVDARWTVDDRLIVLTDPMRQVWREVPRDKIIWILPEQLREAADVTHACWRGPPTQPIWYCVFPAAQGS